MDSASTGKTGNNTIKVAVWMITYNHALYIEEAIESVLRQKCEFNTHLFIGVDYSTDGTLEICLDYQKRYPDSITVLATPERLGPSRNAIRLYRACIDSGAEYMALLEGDDYWIDNDKLQRQVDMMDGDLDVAVVGTSYLIDRDGQRLNCRMNCDGTETTSGCYRFDNKMNLTNWYTKTCTLLLRTSSIPWKNIISYRNICDYHLMYEVLQNGNGIYIDQPTAYYRIHASGIWARKSEAEKSRVTFLIHKELASLHPEDTFVKQMFVTKTRNYVESHSDNLISITLTTMLTPLSFFILTKDIKEMLRLYKRIIVDFAIKKRLLRAG